MTAPPPNIEEAQTRAEVRARLFGEPVEPVRLDRFVILERIGAGAMGVVHAAYDPELDRKIALKVLRSDLPDAARATGRLLAEAKAMAKLAHPNVVTVHEVGRFEGAAFIAMELVDGGTLRSWLEAEPRALDEKLGTLIEAGRGLAAAHEAELVHGDFKPDNVLIDASNRVRVVDFGLARSVDADVTGVAGTPAYMAPEQFDGTSGPKSDQYQFCVTAYEVLFGERPFSGANLAELRKNVAAQRIAAPSVNVPRRLRAALVRGLSIDPSARFGSMNELLDALTPRRRAGPATLLGAAVVTALGVTIAIASRGQDPCDGIERAVDEIWDDTKRAALAQSMLDTGVPHAQATFDAVATAFATQTKNWRIMARAACHATHVDKVQPPAILVARMSCLEDRVEEMKALSRGFEEMDARTVARARTALALLTPVEVCGDLEFLEQRIPPPNDPATRAEVEAVEEQLLDVRTKYVLSRYDEGLVVAKDAYERAHATGHVPLIASAATRLGWLETQKLQLEAAEKHLHEGAQRGLESGNELAMAEAWDMLTFVTASRHADYETAAKLGSYAVALVPTLVGRDMQVASIFGRRGWLFAQMGRFSEALEFHRRSLKIRERSFGPDSPQTGYSQFFLGQTLVFAGRYEEADTHLERAQEIFTKAFSEREIMVIRAIHDRGYVRVTLGDPRGGLEQMKRAYALYVDKYDEAHPTVAYVRLDMARAHLAMNRPDLARPFAERGVQQFAAYRNEEHLEYGEALAVLGRVQLAEGKVTRAVETLRRAVRIVTKDRTEDSFRQLEALEWLGYAEHRANRPKPALEHLKRALDISVKSHGADHASGDGIRRALAAIETGR